MGYQRFVLPSTPATVANPATVRLLEPQTVAEIASVAGGTAEIQRPERHYVASVADAFIPSDYNPGERQTDVNRCFVCGGREAPHQPFIAVLTEWPGAHHWLHTECHPEHRRRCAERRAS